MALEGYLPSYDNYDLFAADVPGEQLYGAGDRCFHGSDADRVLHDL